MSRVLHSSEGRWYEELKIVGYYGESDLERTIQQHLEPLFPEFYVFPYKKDVTHRTTAKVKKPDMAMIRRDLSAWGIIEIELAEHNVGHVLDQTSVFANGDYNAPEVAEYIKRQLKQHCEKTIGLKRLTQLVSSKTPSVTVIVDAMVDGWKNQLLKDDVKLCVFETFKNTRGSYLYRTFGDYPSVSTQEAHCRRHASIANIFEIIGDFDFKKRSRKNEVEIVYDQRLTRWVLFDEKGKHYLQFRGTVNPLNSNSTYRLFADVADRYYLEIN